ncbi:MAG: signal peptidase II [Sandaracinaceae bacterium]|nr:signal peptidase II [Sandaracinaceae bacterium]
MDGARGRYFFLAAVVGAGVVLDQLTKQLAEAYLRGRAMVTVVEGFFELRYTRNPGAFFSLGADLTPMVRRGFFVLASAAAVGLIVRLYARSEPRQRLFRAALALLCAGALGNLVDRVLFGEVIDFVHLHYRDVFDWATFNVADVLIAAGLGLMVADLFRRNGDATIGTPAAERGSP